MKHVIDVKKPYEPLLRVVTPATFLAKVHERTSGIYPAVSEGKGAHFDEILCS